MNWLGKLGIILTIELLTALPSIAQDRQGKSLDMTLTQVTAQSAKPLFQVALHNASNQSLILNLGTMLANGKSQYADALHFSLTDARGKIVHLELKGPPGVAGRIDPLVIPLPRGATFRLPIDLKDYISPQANVWDLKLDQGRYTLSAEYEGTAVLQENANLDMKGLSLMPYWIGNMKSNMVTFTISNVGR